MLVESLSALSKRERKVSNYLDFSFDKLKSHVQIKLITEMKKTMNENVFGVIYGDTREDFYAFEHKSKYNTDKS